MSKTPVWLIFCKVIDNYGDAGVCWRLSCALAARGKNPYLYIDRLETLAALEPLVSPALSFQCVEGVEIRHWNRASESVFSPAALKNVEAVIETFACEVPNLLIETMNAHIQAGNSAPVWINLEYLGLENWTAEWHGMASPHPIFPLVKYFFFPGFTEKSGGLLRDARQGISNGPGGFETPSPPASLPSGEGITPPNFSAERELKISLFCYDTPLEDWLSLLSLSPFSVEIYVPPGQPTRAVNAALPFGKHGALTLIPLPFLRQENYDRLLEFCDLNMVRGEDSFIRAQWAGKPFLWQAYRQAGNAQHKKMDAFLAQYSEDLEARAAAAFKAMTGAWNEMGNTQNLPRIWGDFMENFSILENHQARWRENLIAQSDLCERLIWFVRMIFESSTNTLSVGQHQGGTEDIKVGRHTGFEPVTTGITIQCSTN